MRPLLSRRCKLHTTTDDQGITLLQQVGDYVQLICNLCTARIATKGLTGSSTALPKKLISFSIR